ncbi:vesicular glutamate transporter [Bombus vancouverensis nearcticus]|uniref:Vesicular glutamate transporter 1 n=1 Tax=Bombus bifarius TaxID=103933 RepID=A0A6P8N9P9_9HYME|nr:vesicular glutamate transporter 1 [Bombus vancouverensis nearcticus]XP_033199009.1 vesicular glutamate transporter 1 [Bombus vancouverensis nearcticus]XP_033199011.1 vesicular glutamate transporter 1 [Bombus vancouverensis nearcticus]XP_033311285.1 vesicular glutamate transporter 1 [Bombus bifarius]XP_033311287.1 vesicular glutamate transporter 1 [Bombus bifarius]XP_033311288.1 vesicular glutamate transporter 1 [Bombus bifarius]
MSGFAAAGLVAFDSIKSKASRKLAGLRRSNAGYEEFEMPREGSKDNKGFEDERGYSRQASFESLPEPERPPLRHIDTYCKPECPCLSKRYTIATLACIGFIISFGMRCNMGMAKMAMKNATEDNANHTLRFNWTIGTESALDSSFFWGYLVTQVPGGFLASLYPANKIFGAAIAVSSFLNLLVPGALSIHPIVDMIVQVIKGLVEGVTYPACHGIWKYWAPPLERSRLATLAFCGSYAAMVIGMPLSGLLTSTFGWAASFYFYGICGLIWYCFWLWLAFEKPSKHPCISARELRYIEDSLGQGQSQLPMAMPTFATTPWRKFLTSMPVHAIIVANFCRSWNFYLLVLFQARFMHEAFDMPLVETGVIGSLPHLLMTMIVPCGGLLADYIRKRGILSTTNVRKLFNCGGFGMEALFFLVVSHATMKRNGTAAIFALACGVACSGFAISGFNVNHLDIAPRYASILMGMSNGIGTIAGLLVPFFVDNITEKKDTQSWRNVFIIAACVHIFGVIFYGLFCSGELQPWADPNLDEQKTFAMDEFGQAKPPLPPPPKTMQSEFIRQPSMGDGAADDWNNYDQPPAADNIYAQQEKPPVISYGSTETNSNNPFHSTNPFASDVNASLVQPPATTDYAYDVTQQNQQWN